MRFEYLEPTSIQEVIELLVRYDGRAKVMAGGTDLLVQMRKRDVKSEYVVHMGNVRGLKKIRCDEQAGLKIGALTTIRALERSHDIQEKYPVISRAAGQLGSVAVRNMATIGGNICNAAPSADMVPALIALSAQARIMGPEGEKRILLEDFFVGPGKTVLGKGEILTEIDIPLFKPNTGATYFSYGRRGTMDLAIVGVGALTTLGRDGRICDDVKIVLGAVAPTPIRALRAEGTLRGKPVDEALIEESGQSASEECQPITDVRAPASYRREMVKVFTQRALKEALRLAKPR